ncbi:1-aminocyclopropane-1-carboxylate deaminase/D-cysteine desulfhydrase [Pendulispora albinea]|uniref:D-cysteine desulfhydrase family protein n=1 Tax=Pendulispora albinea TaxID=2741071 RepID=A0ABZ2M9U0_9BACT
MRARIPLIHGPTPIVRSKALSSMLGVELYIKRDDTTGGAEAGNKLRKLEFLLGDAIDRRATCVITCGGTQSNHARATAIAAAGLGLRCILFLRMGDAEGRPEHIGNMLLDRLVGAEIRPTTAQEYRDRTRIMTDAAHALEDAGERPYLIQEGGSNGLGALGYVEAMRETRLQLDHGIAGGGIAFDVIAHACGSGGTAAGTVLGAGESDVAAQVWSFAVSDNRHHFEQIIARIIDEARALDPSLTREARLVVDDGAKGPAYAVMSEEQRAFLVRVARTSGILLDPSYTGKAMFGLAQAVARGAIPRGARVLFLHTGGLPGLLAQGPNFEGVL